MPYGVKLTIFAVCLWWAIGGFRVGLVYLGLLESTTIGPFYKPSLAPLPLIKALGALGVAVAVWIVAWPRVIGYVFAIWLADTLVYQYMASRIRKTSGEFGPLFTPNAEEPTTLQKGVGVFFRVYMATGFALIFLVNPVLLVSAYLSRNTHSVAYWIIFLLVYNGWKWLFRFASAEQNKSGVGWEDATYPTEEASAAQHQRAVRVTLAKQSAMQILLVVLLVILARGYPEMRNWTYGVGIGWALPNGLVLGMQGTALIILIWLGGV